MKFKYNVDVTDRTLRSWCSKLIGSNIIQKCGEKTFWKTQMFGREKFRTKVDADNEEMARYFQKRDKHLRRARKSAADLELAKQETDAWSATYKKLWREFHCCYYSCSGLLFNAIGEDYIFEIYELAWEIAAAAVIPPPDKRKINSKEEYHETWFKKHL